MTNEILERLEASLEDHADDVRLEFVEQWHFDYDALCKLAESPIERLLGGRLLLANDGYSRLTARIPWHMNHLPLWGTLLGCQVPIGSYRVDFLIRCCYHDTFRLLVVECDGHDFHERTKEQAKRDKSRDRWFLSQGISVMRFTGSEVWNDVEKCADDVSGQLMTLNDQLLVAAGIMRGTRKDPLA